MLKQRQFDKENGELTAVCNDKIWNQVNQFIEDYGKEKQYRFVLGATGEGTIMFGDKHVDVTDETLAYLNNRYNDKEN